MNHEDPMKETRAHFGKHEGAGENNGKLLDTLDKIHDSLGSPEAEKKDEALIAFSKVMVEQKDFALTIIYADEQTRKSKEFTDLLSDPVFSRMLDLYPIINSSVFDDPMFHPGRNMSDDVELVADLNQSSGAEALARITEHENALNTYSRMLTAYGVFGEVGLGEASVSKQDLK